LQFIAVLPTTNDQVVYGSKHTYYTSQCMSLNSLCSMSLIPTPNDLWHYTAYFEIIARCRNDDNETSYGWR